MLTIDIGAKVVTRDRKKAASVSRVVMDPGTGEITHLVLHKGVVIARDVVVPVTAVRQVRNGTVYLDLTVAELEGMPDFVETDYVLPQRASTTGPYAPGSVLWPTAYAYAPVVEREEKHVPPEAVDITEGTDVNCADGRVGVVDEVVVLEGTGEIVGLVLKRGLFGHRNGVIPYSWVKYADSEVVELNCRKKDVEDYFRSEDIRG